MSKSTYFALVGIETLSLQELLTCQAIQNGLSPTDWTNPLEPEPPPSSSSSPILNSDTTELTLVECVRTPLVGPYGTTHGLDSAPSPSFCITPEANICDSNVHEDVFRSSAAQASTPQGILMDTNLPGPSVFE
ncbi:hypothetical protein BS47DRAFT_1387270 [Hydnum rufescens UP504]|uniref:Uncharacterized protein n=1 Tax=Hydnum rufescens UP504 TaxID=1448309 RepID=A0A9P6BD99_9AGAM|nr:hypothetical protein BS47DRAFT_1387270 [Hydnum rufescens UP504]